MSSPPRKRVRSSLEDVSSGACGTMITEDGPNSSNPRSPSGERRNKKAMKIQSQRNSATSLHSSPGRRGASEDDSEPEGEFSPANSGVDPNFLRAIKKTTDLSKRDQEVRYKDKENKSLTPPKYLDSTTDWSALV